MPWITGLVKDEGLLVSAGNLIFLFWKNKIHMGYVKFIDDGV